MLKVSHTVAERFRRTQLRGDEILLTLVGNPGIVALSQEEWSGWNVARAIGVLRPKQVNRRYLYYALSSPGVQVQIERLLNTTVQRTLNLSDALNLRIPACEVRLADAIAEVLGALDDKITANVNERAALEELARRTFSNAPSRPERLTSLATFVNGRNFTKDATGDGRVVIRIAEMNSGIGASTVWNDVPAADENIARPGDILFAWSGSLTLDRWMADEALVNQHIFKVIPAAGVPAWLVYQAVASELPGFRAIAAGKATTMGHIKRGDLEVETAVPTWDESVRIHGLMQGLWDLDLALARQSQTLASLRDTLLPGLMDGSIHVKDAEARVSNEL